MDEFLENTTIHCMVHLRTKSNKIRTFWVLSLMVAVFTIIIGTALILRDYLEYDSYISTKQVDVENIDAMPTIFICLNDTLNLQNSVIRIRKNYTEIFKYYNQVFNKKEIVASLHKFDLDSYLAELGLLNSTLLRLYGLQSEQFDGKIIEEIKDDFYENHPFRRFRCTIEAFEMSIYCENFATEVFTPYGGCLAINFTNAALLSTNYSSKQSYDYPPFDEYNIKIILNYITRNFNGQKMFFYLNSEKMLSLGNLIDFPLKRHAIKTVDPHNMEIQIVSEKYSQSLHGIKCLNGEYSEQYCQFECLHSLIIKLLKCNFIVKLNNAFNICSLHHLPLIELIMKHFDDIASKTNLCKHCLKDCESINYEIVNQEVYTFGSNSISLSFSFSFQMTETTTMLSMEYSQFLNLINGLWSLFLGISVLSIWELFEVSISNTSKYLKRRLKFVKNMSNIFGRLKLSDRVKSILILSKIYKITALAFENTVLHGFKHFFYQKSSIMTRIRWLAVIVASAICLYLSINNAIDDYLQFYTDLIERSESLDSNEMFNRNLSILICIPLKNVVNKDLKNNYAKLFNNAEDLIKKQNYSLELKLRTYKALVKNLTNYDKETLSNMTNTGIQYVYENIVFSLPLLNTRSDLVQPNVYPHLYYNEKVCYSIDSFSNKQPLSNLWKFDFEFKKVNYNNLMYFIVVDTNDVHISKQSFLQFSRSQQDREIYLKLRHFRFLGDPYQPLCIDSKAYAVKNNNNRYSRYDCYLKCYNEIVYEVFNCKLIYLNHNEIDMKYCHPLVLPFIETYIKLKLYNWKKHVKCSSCLAPCEAFYYELTTTVLPQSMPVFSIYLIPKQTIVTEKQVSITPLSNILVIILSYFGLFFGGSFLSLIQILFNIFTRAFIKRKYNNNRRRNFKTSYYKRIVSNVIANLSTFHGINYISVDNSKKTFFWLIAILSVVCLNIWYSFSEIQLFLGQTTTTRTREIYMSNSPIIHWCKLRSNFTEDAMKTNNPLLNHFLSTSALYLKNSDLHCLNSFNFNCSWNDHIRSVHLAYNQMIQLLKKNETEFKDTEKLKWSDIIKEDIQNGYGKSNFEVEFNGVRKTHFPIEFFPNDLISVKMCSVINLNSFTNTTEKSINRKSKSLFGTSNYILKIHPNKEAIEDKFFLYYNNLLLENAHIGNQLTEIIKEVYRYYNDIKCIDNKNLVNHNLENLFFCNPQLKTLFLEVFKCTPFYSSASFDNSINTYDECSILMMPFIKHLFQIFTNSKLYNKCVLCVNVNETETYSHIYLWTGNNENVVNIDFNNIRTFEHLDTLDLETIQFINNIANFFNITIGTSFLTIIELFFLIGFHILYSKMSISPS